MAGFCLNLAKASKNGVFRDAVTNNGVEITHASTDAFLRAWVSPGHMAPPRGGPGNGEPFQSSYTAPSGNTTRRQRRRTIGTTAKNRRGAATAAPSCSVELSRVGSKTDGPLGYW